MRHFPSLALMLFATIAMGCAANDDDPSLDSDDAASSSTAAEQDSVWRSLLRHDAWEPSTASQDPQSDHRPSDVSCNGGWYPELQGIEIDTSACNYLSLTQPLGAPLVEGDPIVLRMWWATLASIEPAQGHIAVFVDDALLWEEHVAIPGEAQALTEEFDSPLSAPEGASLTLHLHNHGYNTWNFNELSAFGSSP